MDPAADLERVYRRRFPPRAMAQMSEWTFLRRTIHLAGRSTEVYLGRPREPDNRLRVKAWLTILFFSAGMRVPGWELDAVADSGDFTELSKAFDPTDPKLIALARRAGQRQKGERR